MNLSSKILLALLFCIFCTIGNVYAQTIVVDDFSKDCILEGIWADNKSNGYGGGGTVGGRFHYTSTHAPFKKTGREKALYKPNLPKAGKYSVSVSWRATENRSTSVTYEVRFKGGSKKIKVNQKDGKDMTWKKLGIFSFDAGNKVRVVFLSDGGRSGAIDAAKFQFVGPGGDADGDSPMDDVLGDEVQDSEGTGDSLVSLTNNDQGTKNITIKKDGKICATAFLSTYGSASLQATVNGKVWITWARQDDKDGSKCIVDSKTLDRSMFEEKAGDFSPKEVSTEKDVQKGDIISVTLEGDFGNGDSYIRVK